MAERLLERNIPSDRTIWKDTRGLVLDDIDPPDVGGRPIIIPRFPNRFPAPESPQRREISPNLPKNSPLEKAGFLLHRQMINFLEGIRNGSLDNSLAELISNIRAHANEYTRERPLLEGSVKRTDKVVNKYNNEPVVNHLDFQEREGATARGNLELERKVLEVKPGESVIQISPPGWNGLYPDYEKAQFVYFRVKDENSGELEQLTFVVNYSVEKCLDLLCAVGINRADLVCASQKETIKKMVGQAYLLTQDMASPKDFFNLVKNISNRPNDPVFAVVERDLDRLEKEEDISVLPSTCENYIQDLEGFILDNADRLKDFAIQVDLSDRIEETIYKIATYIRGTGFKNSAVILSPKDEGSSNSRYRIKWEDSSLIARNDNWRDQYRDIIGVLQQISGCAGGGRSRAVGGIFSTGISSGLDSSFLDKDQYGSLEFPCGKCNRINRRSYGQLIPNCQHCGASTNC